MAENAGRIEYQFAAETDGVLKAGTVVDKTTGKMVKDFDRVDKSVKNFNTQTTKASQGVRRAFGSNLGQAGIQVQQFVGQLQGGQSAMVALAQQSADLGIVLGAPLVGVVVSLAAVLIGTLAPALFDSGKKVDELREKLEKLVETNTLTREQADVLIAAEEKKNKERKKSIKELEKEEKTLRQRLVLSQNTIKNYDEESKTYKNLIKGQKELTNQINQNVASQQVLNLEIGESTDKIRTYNSVVSDEQVPVTKEQKSAIDSLVGSLEDQAATIGMSARGVALYSAEQILNTKAQKENLEAVKQRINASFDTIEAYKSESAAIKQTADDLAWYEQQLSKINQEQERLAQRGTTVGLTEVQSIEMRYESDLEALKAAREQQLITNQEYDMREIELNKQKVEAIKNANKDGFDFLGEAFGNLDTQIAGTMAQVVIGAKDGKEAMRSLANTMLTQVVGTAVKWGVELVKNRVLGQALATSEQANIAATTATGIASQQAATASTVASAGATATAAAPAAALTSTFSFGSAAVIGGIALLGTLAIAKMMGGRQYGGPVSNGMYRVNETGAPEVYSYGGKDYLMNTKNANIKNLDQGSGGGMTVNISNNTPYEVFVTQDQAAQIANIQIGKEAGKAAKGRGQMLRGMQKGTNLQRNARS